MKIKTPSCPVDVTLSLIADKWKIFIIYELIKGSKRHGEIRRGLKGISQKVLTENLRSMEKCGLLSKLSYDERPLRVEYSLTELGHSLLPILNSMFDWGTAYLQGINAANISSDD